MDATQQLADTREADVQALRRRIAEYKQALGEIAYIAACQIETCELSTFGAAERVRERMEAILAIVRKVGA